MELWTAFFLGLVGSAHCAGMCGPLALALPATGQTRATFLAGRLLYNAGRLVTYIALGLLFGLLGEQVALAGWQRWLSLGAGVAILLGVIAASRWATALPAYRLVAILKSALGQLLRQRSHAAAFAIGVLNGLLPCGLVYVAVASAAAQGDQLTGALFMGAFGLGTLPMMFALSLAGARVQFTLRGRLQRAIPIVAVLAATLLILRGMALGIPYVSPDLTAGGAGCCAAPVR